MFEVLTSQSYKFSLLGVFAEQLQKANIVSVLSVGLCVHMEKPETCSSDCTKYLIEISVEICHTYNIVFISVKVSDILHKYICKYLVMTGRVLLRVVEVQNIIGGRERERERESESERERERVGIYRVFTKEWCSFKS